MRSGVLAGGNWIVDRVKIVERWPAQDGLSLILGETVGNGGAAYNVLIDLARLKAPFPLGGIGLIGDDGDGRRIRADCRSHGINSRRLYVTRKAPTSYTDVVTVRRTGRRTFFHQCGANALLEPKHFNFGKSRAKWFHLGYLLLLDELDRIGPDGLPRAADVLRRARAAGMRTSLDSASISGDRLARIVPPVLPFVDCLFANDFEAGKLTGIPLSSRGRLKLAAVRSAARRLLAFGVRKWIIVHSPEGVWASSAAGREIWQPSVRVPPSEVKGAAGAGDAVAAGVLYGLHQGWRMPDSLRLAVCAAAASLRDPTCSRGVVGAAECLALGRRFGFRTGPRS
jgi:sugar/nucleoside kinase (ribokinase family)